MNALSPGKSDQAAPLVGIVVIIAAAMGVYFWGEPLRTFRPPAQEQPRPPLEPRLPARLWQDPIQEARESLARSTTGTTPQGHVQSLPEHDQVLAVTVYGGYGQLDHETRLRSRYAVQVALSEAEYVPNGEDTEFLRFLCVRKRPDPSLGKDHCCDPEDATLPFELWLKSGPVVSKVLVLWIDDTLLGDRPRSKLLGLMDQADPAHDRHADVRMVGPSSSSGLKDLIAEGGDWPEHIYSPWATADEVFLFNDNECLDRLQMPRIYRTIATDREACGRLVEELLERKIRLRNPGDPDGKHADTIMVLSEWDTVYGQALPVTFAACVLVGATGKSCADGERAREFRENVRGLRNGNIRWPREIIRAEYLRGLDGIGPRNPGELKKADKAEKETKPSLAAMERPDGASQLDYARRLADEVKNGKLNSLRAVGVLGADIYDKLLLLQALRERLPTVFFFTTDLDAAYLHPSQNEWSRNLLVASSFGLSTEGMKISPPFRDAYGVAIRSAVRHALSEGSEKPLSGRIKEPTVSIYEIGRTSAHRLGPDDSRGEEKMRNGVSLLLLILLIGVLLAMLVMHIGHDALWWWLAVLAFLFAILITLFVGVRKEPLLWLEGISIWPTEVVRLTVIAGAVILLRQVDRAMQKNLEELGGVFHFAGPSANQNTREQPWWRAWRQLTEAPHANAGGRLAAWSLWHSYQEAEDHAGRWWRAGSLSGFIMLLIGAMLSLDPPPRPCRGDFSCTVDLVVAVLSMAAVLMITCYVADATAACTCWLRCMISVRTVWSDTRHDSGAELPGQWYEVEIVARRTQVVGHLILYPFLLLLLLILSRSDVFDRWSWPGSLVLAFMLPLGVALISTLLLRSTAERLRSKCYAEAREIWSDAIRAGDGTKVEHAESAMKSIQAESRGAFSPFTQNPALAAVLLPLGGAGTGLALEKLLQYL